MKQEMRIEFRFLANDESAKAKIMRNLIKDAKLIDWEVGIDGLVEQVQYTRLIFDIHSPQEAQDAE